MVHVRSSSLALHHCNLRHIVSPYLDVNDGVNDGLHFPPARSVAHSGVS